VTCYRRGTGAYLRLPGSITRTQCTGTVPNTSEEGGLWLGIEGGWGPSFSVELEQADDRESSEALHRGEILEVSERSPSQRDVHKAVNVVHTRHKQRVEHGVPGTLWSPAIGSSSITAHMEFIRTAPCNAWMAHAKDPRRRARRSLYECIGRSRI